jgi:hypothetical protein
MAQGTRKTPWEHFMTAASQAERLNRRNKGKTKILSLRQQLANLDKSIEQAANKPVKKIKEKEEKQFSFAADVINESNWNQSK